MNSLNIVSRLTTTPPPSPPRSRTSSAAHIGSLPADDGDAQNGSFSFDSLAEKLRASSEGAEDSPSANGGEDEKTPLLDGSKEGMDKPPQQKSRLWQIPKRVANAILYGAAVVISTIAAPGRMVIACFYDEQGHFSAILPLKNFRSLMSRRRRKSLAQRESSGEVPNASVQYSMEHPRRTSKLRSTSVNSDASEASAMTSDGDSDNEKKEDSPARHTRSRTAEARQEADDAAQRKMGRVKLLPNEDALRKRKVERARQRRQQASTADGVAVVATALKSPSSAATTAKMTRYPRAPAPPRPLVPRRQPSYSLAYSAEAPKKTLIIDLDETLIHSMAKGGRMSTGHMVEVRLGGPISSSGVRLGPGVPILYYVHERPGCHDFLRKVGKWYNLVIFTASVQEYADPVIDWVERERKYFSGRYYRQHCTFRNGAYIKDLAQVEPDLSKVMILDNSPMSYIFHEDNAIPIEGWISDPTDNDLIHLIPLLEGLQYVTDVRALLALRQGQAQQA